MANEDMEIMPDEEGMEEEALMEEEVEEPIPETALSMITISPEQIPQIQELGLGVGDIIPLRIANILEDGNVELEVIQPEEEEPLEDEMPTEETGGLGSLTNRLT